MVERVPSGTAVDFGGSNPSLYVETTTHERPKAEIEALSLAKEKTRLSDFSEWTIEVVPTGRKLWNGKWLTLWEIEEIKGRL